MKAPRKIITARRIGSGRRDILTAETTMSMGYVDANTYHHDDVVRELVAALEMAVLWLEFDGRYDVQGMKAALVKIAQDA